MMQFWNSFVFKTVSEAQRGIEPFWACSLKKSSMPFSLEYFFKLSNNVYTVNRDYFCVLHFFHPPAVNRYIIPHIKSSIYKF